MIEKLNTWLLVAVLVISAGSVAANQIISDQHNRAVSAVADRNRRSAQAATCNSATDENARLRGFVARLVASPSTPPRVRDSLIALALQQFPLVPDVCVTK